MFEVRLEQATHLKNVLEALSDMFGVAYFDFSELGWEIQAADTSGVELAALLREDAFASYQCPRQFSRGLNLANIAEVFRCANNDDKITIETEEWVFAPLLFTFTSPKNGEISEYYFDAVDIKGAPIEIQEPSESEYQAIVRLPSQLFMFICSKLSSFGDCEDRDTVVIISVDKEHEGVSFFARGEKKTSKIVYPPETTRIEMKEKVSLMFAVRYIKSFSKISALSDEVTIGLSSMKPAMFKCEIPMMGNVRYYISPVHVTSAASRL